MRALVVLPTYEEAHTIREVLAGVRRELPGATVLVVDDGSPDGTAERAEAAGEELGQIQVLRRPSKLGLGSAYR
ncbi:MAG TPA: glycosyltransferase, partial [Acidimicrobiales bacterium]|nr:glycosyltransferase [Acidimicrobiales bacterium]